MEVFLPTKCVFLSGSLGRGFGYTITPLCGRFFSKRFSKGYVPADGHYRFILACAKLAKIGLHIRDIEVTRNELLDAAREASADLRDAPYTFIYFYVKRDTTTDVYHAQQILDIHQLFSTL